MGASSVTIRYTTYAVSIFQATNTQQRNWTVVTANATTLTFSLLDEAFEGFPGNVVSFILLVSLHPPRLSPCSP